jgi:hypothetical protein
MEARHSRWIVGLGILTALAAPAAAQITSRQSLATGGGQGHGTSYSPVLTPDGRYVTLYSEAADLVPGDTNGDEDVFVRDRATGITVRVSVSSTGLQGNWDSYDPVISSDARFVAFYSEPLGPQFLMRVQESEAPSQARATTLPAVPGGRQSGAEC